MNINKRIKKFLILLTCLMFINTAYQITNTYAVFYSRVHGIVGKEIGKWNILINGNDISSTPVAEELIINNLIIQRSSHTQEGKFSPGTVGSFEITIAPYDTDVSVKYELFIDETVLKDNRMEVVSVEEIQENNNIIKTPNNTYIGVIPLSSIKNGVTNTVKITFKWENDENHNLEDSKIGAIANYDLKIPISIKVSQYLGEEIN